MNGIENKIFFSKYKPEKKIGEGSFGKIYSAININSNENFALKMEMREGGQNLLESEAYVLCYLKGFGIPSVKSYGFSGDHNILVMELLGKSLEDLFQDNGGKFSLKTVCMLADQMIDRIQYIHDKHIIHRDIKPDNFTMGIKNTTSVVYLIDFGLAKKYRSSKNLQHIQFKNNKKLTGTARYASINALRGVEQSRRDDLEAIGYVLMYFLRGSLPWQGLKVDKKEDRYKKIYEKKKNTTPEDLCAGFPIEFTQYITYCRNLAFEQEPDYNYIKSLFSKIMTIYGNQYDNDFDFTKKGSNILLSNPPEEEENKNKTKKELENNNDENLAKANKAPNQSNPKFFENLNNYEQNNPNFNRQYIDTVQFNAGKDYLQAPQRGTGENFQTNMNHTIGNNNNNNTTPNNNNQNLQNTRNNKENNIRPNNENTNKRENTAEDVEKKNSSKKNDKCIIF